MRILLTGGAGFIGSWIAEYYLEDGHELLIVDNLSTGIKENIPVNAEFIKGDIRDTAFLEKIFNEFSPEVVNHHAAQIDVRISVDDPQFDASVNIMGTLNILENSRKRDVRKIIFASTGGAIYGEPELLPADESTNQEPLSPYGTSKLCAENYLNYYKRIYGLNFTALRYSNVYGQRQNPHGEAGVIAIFCNNILNGSSCKIFGTGEQTRDYVHCEDVAKANILSLTSKDGIYNIGTSVETSVNSIIENLKTISERDFKVEYLPKRLGEVERISLDASSAFKELGWSPRIKFHEGLRKTWDWFSENN